MPRRRREQTIFFPWERRTGFWRMSWRRSRPLLAAVVMIVLLALLGARERTRTATRATRATLLVVRGALDAYRADHEGRCPAAVAVLRQEGYLTIEPADAWGRPLQLTCPGRRDPEGYDLASFGPSGDMRGLDRVE